MDHTNMFNAAANHLQEIINDLSSHTKDDDLLYLYARYKQATVGPCNVAKPGFMNITARKKWNRWNSLMNMSKEQAMTEYIDKIRTLDDSWTPQATTVRTGMGVAVSVMDHKDEKILTDGEKTVFDYCKEGSLDKVKELLVGNPKDEEDRTLLHWACDRGHLEIAEFLIAKGLDVNCKDNDLSTPLHYAASCDHVEIVELLLSNQADINAKDSDGETPVQCASAQRIQTVLDKFSKA